MMFGNFYRNKTVLVTGHTGFKGAWVCHWLLSLGADVIGYALDPQPHELLFDQLGLHDRLQEDHRANLNDIDRLCKVVEESQADVILHLAAQPLVRLSYDKPVETFSTNVMGTVHLLESVRRAGHACSVVCVTTDKCYENLEKLDSYRENDAMGGHDPYSASKGAAELAIASYRQSFFPASGDIKVASARAGNVIGGGDWADDRIVPDCIRALRNGNSILVRNKIATRPWQHVLEPLSGYLWLGAIMGGANSGTGNGGAECCEGFNFGPSLQSNRKVAELVVELLKHIPGDWLDTSNPSAPHEASKLNLAIDKAFHMLGWEPVWNFEETLEKTATWYLEEEKNKNSMRAFTNQQIVTYQTAASELGVSWAV